MAKHNKPAKTPKYLGVFFIYINSNHINKKYQNDSFKDKVNGTENRKCGYRKGSYSERKVAENEDWTFEQIKARGLEMLDFMEKRWAFKFENEDAKLKVLNIDDETLNKQ